ncbi:something about silencing, SAS, complex subunit 4-domain-containing protein [Podospora australis]|uniref:Something about silencing, SAS, complex subunit 4-domain-containing protein n=1 Tax=Podospora australis TaxID=1536484 RepID=A0AAN7AMS1_9PEZI|nr:something about silencing, SAS, complex subunit 4-domain-containing protein [Podospora australis]
MAMTSSATRSRRAEGFQVSHSHKIPNVHHRLVVNAKAAAAAAAAAATAQANNQFVVSPPRAKRQLEVSTLDCDPVVPKKVRIEVGIPSRSALHSRIATKATDAKPPQLTPTKPAIAGIPPPPNPERPTRAAAAPPTKAATTTDPNTTKPQPARTKHQEKVVNGLKHELNRLQPNAADTSSQGGRKLRSQEATRFKSELSNYFPDYDEIIGNDPKEKHLLNTDTPIVITADAAPCTTRSLPHIEPTFPIHSYSDALYTTLFDAKEVDLDFLSQPYTNKSPDDQDPLPDSLYEPYHKKSERQEKSVRNHERGYAQHEKEVVLRLLDGLQGYDWLRVMGVSGVTETKKKEFEGPREQFIKGCHTILDKFKRWTAEEKRIRKERERREAERRAARDATTTTEGDEDEEGGEEQEIPNSDADDEDVEESDEDQVEEIADTDDERSDDDSDDETSIAKQLREEAALAKRKNKVTKKPKAAPPPLPSQSKSRRRGDKAHVSPPSPPARSRRSRSARHETPSPPPPPPPAVPQKKFTSFFAKRYERDAALNKNRRRNRKVLAWGKPVPEVEDRDFELPDSCFEPESLESRARRKRRDLRAKH